MYFLEWVAILSIPSVPTEKLGHDPSTVVAAYGHPKAIGVAAGWFSVVLFGRVIFTIGLRDAFRGLRRERLFANIAVAAMGLSVAIEVVSSCGCLSSDVSGRRGRCRPGARLLA